MQFLERLKPLGLLVLRWGLAIIFFYYGYPKLANAHTWMQNFVRMGFPPYFTFIAGTLEVFGSILLFIGLFTRVPALLLAGEMVVVIWRVRLAHASIYAVDKYDLPLALCVGAFALATLGAGKMSMDALLFGSGRPSIRKSKNKG